MDNDRLLIVSQKPMRPGSWRCGYSIVEMLVARGADRAATDSEGNTAADSALAGGHVEIAEYLQSLDAAAD